MRSGKDVSPAVVYCFRYAGVACAMNGIFTQHHGQGHSIDTLKPVGPNSFYFIYALNIFVKTTGRSSGVQPEICENGSACITNCNGPGDQNRVFTIFGVVCLCTLLH